MRQVKFCISISICVIWTQLLLDARTRYPYSAHRRLWSDCASVIRLHLAHFVKYCFAVAYKWQPLSFFGHTSPTLAVVREGVDVTRQTKFSYIVLTLQKHALHQSCSSEYYDNTLIFHIFVSSCSFRANCVAVYGVIMQLPLG